AFFTDFRYNKIPNWLTVSGMITGIFVNSVYEGFAGLQGAIIGLLGMFAVTMILYMTKALGAGDVKWFSGLGSLTGLVFSMYTFLLAVIFAGCIAVVIIIFRSRRHGMRRTFPFMHAVLPGVAGAYYLVQDV